jgi:hypothetical protein
MSNDISALETRIAGLKAKIAQREAQQSLGVSEGQHGGRSNRFLESHRKELHDLALNYITLKCSGHGWDPIHVIETYRG